MTEPLLERSFDNEVVSIERARSAAAEASQGRLSPDAVEVVRLLTSELVTNSVKHGSGPIGVTVEADGDRLTVSVRDAGEATVGIPVLDPSPGGHGLRLVDALSTGWEQVSVRPTEIRFWVDGGGASEALRRR